MGVQSFSNFPLREGFGYGVNHFPYAADVTGNTGYGTNQMPSANSKASQDEFHPALFSRDHKQGNINDCYFVAPLYGALNNPNIGPEKLAKMIKPVSDPQGKFPIAYEVTFPGHQPVKVELDELSPRQLQGGLGNQIMERAFAEVQERDNRLGVSDRTKVPPKDPKLDQAWDRVNHGGTSEGLETLTGKKAETILSNFTFQYGTDRLVDPLIEKMRQDPDRYVIEASSPKSIFGLSSDYMDKEKRFRKWHAYDMRFDPKTQEIIMTDPQDTAKKQYRITAEEMKKYFTEFSIIDLKKAN